MDNVQHAQGVANVRGGWWQRRQAKSRNRSWQVSLGLNDAEVSVSVGPNIINLAKEKRRSSIHHLRTD
jgi:hypothetical protein